MTIATLSRPSLSAKVSAMLACAAVPRPRKTEAARPWSHLDATGRARMVDVSAKPVTRRVAEASCRVRLSSDTVGRLADLPKGDAFAVARLAGIQAAKRTADWIPLAHPLPLEQVEVSLSPEGAEVAIQSRVVVTAKTGAEMEALVACAAAALALYDMVKALERGAVVAELRLEAKSGGRSGTYRRG
jgi:cyclic pyranopterin phosphate synthase